VYIHVLNSIKLLPTFSPPKDGITSLIWNGRTQYLASCSYDKRIKVLFGPSVYFKNLKYKLPLSCFWVDLVLGHGRADTQSRVQFLLLQIGLEAKWKNRRRDKGY
jgi:WD40 repeat protein